jgi:glutathione S-transferase
MSKNIKNAFLCFSLMILLVVLVGYPINAKNVKNNDNNFEKIESQKTPLKLYGGPRTRTPIVEWYLQELNIPYQYISLDIAAKEHKQPAYLKINPMGKVPAIVDDNFTLWESGAILIYLANKYQQIPENIQAQSIINQWVIFANATLSPGLFLPDRRDQEMSVLLTPINDILGKQSFILGDNLTVADIELAGYIYYAQKLFNLDYQNYPHLVNYLNNLSQRPAFKNTIGKRFNE